MHPREPSALGWYPVPIKDGLPICRLPVPTGIDLCHAACQPLNPTAQAFGLNVNQGPVHELKDNPRPL